MRRQITVLMMLTAFASTLIAPMAVQAGSIGRRNTAIAGTAATIYLLAKGKTGTGLLAAAGTAYAWKRYNDSRRSELRHRSYRYGYRRGYGRGYGRGYRVASAHRYRVASARRHR